MNSSLRNGLKARNDSRLGLRVSRPPTYRSARESSTPYSVLAPLFFRVREHQTGAMSAAEKERERESSRYWINTISRKLGHDLTRYMRRVDADGRCKRHVGTMHDFSGTGLLCYSVIPRFARGSTEMGN